MRPGVADPRAVGEGEAVNIICAAAEARGAVGGKFERGDLQNIFAIVIALPHETRVK